MQIKGKIPLIIVAAFSWLVVISSCANIGMPEGGPRDSVPPVLMETSPGYRALNFDGKNVKFTFNEYLQVSEISEALVISPPLEKRQSIKTKSKTLIIQFNEELKDSTTYSLDFKNSVVDNNEKNPIEDFRFSFSTGPIFDSLRVAGKVVNSFNLEPIEKGLVMLHNNLHDSTVFTLRPNYIAKTNELGLFLIDNIASGTYHIFALNDLNGDMLYNEGAEEIAFMDTLVVPSVEFHEELDTLTKGVDSLMILGHSHFHPDPFYLRYFTEDIFEQFLESAEREERNKCLFLFNESVRDTFNVKLLNAESEDWQLFEYNSTSDSLVMWITDTMVSRQDSLEMELSYYQLDSAAQRYVQKDTLLMKFSDPKVDTKKKKRKKDKDKEKPEPTLLFNWGNNLSSTMELNGLIRITAPQPIAHFDSTKITLYLSSDTLKTPLNFTFKKNESAYRTYNILYDWEPEEGYSLVIDSAACVNIFGINSAKLEKSFNVREEDYYGTITFSFTNVDMPIIVQILKNNDDEDVLREAKFEKDGDVFFEYLKPEKYKAKVIYDENGNGKWDQGSYQDKIQPERVAYDQEVIKLRSNWSENYSWDLTPDVTFTKKIRDVELEAKKKKEAAEKLLKEREAEKKSSPLKSGNSSSNSGAQRFK